MISIDRGFSGYCGVGLDGGRGSVGNGGRRGEP